MREGVDGMNENECDFDGCPHIKVIRMPGGRIYNDVFLESTYPRIPGFICVTKARQWGYVEYINLAAVESMTLEKDAAETMPGR